MQIHKRVVNEINAINFLFHSQNMVTNRAKQPHWAQLQIIMIDTFLDIKMVSRRAQKSRFLKNENISPRYSRKEQVYQISAKSYNFWSLQPAPKFYGQIWDWNPVSRI